MGCVDDFRGCFCFGGRGGDGGEMGRVAMFIYCFHALPASALQLQLQL